MAGKAGEPGQGAQDNTRAQGGTADQGKAGGTGTGTGAAGGTGGTTEGQGGTGAQRDQGTGKPGDQGAPGGTQGKSATTDGQQGRETGTPQAPAKYELTMPDGGQVDDSDVKRLETIARKNNWTNEEAQAALDEFNLQLATQSDTYLATTKADADYGGEKLADTQRLANLGINAIRPEGHARRDAFMRLLQRAGIGNHIEVISFLADLGKRVGEDRPGTGLAAGGRVGDTHEERAAQMYDHPTSQALAGKK